MGSMLTKVAPSPTTVKVHDEPVAMSTMVNSSTPNRTTFLDPRSPNPFRTPIAELPLNDAKPVSRAQNLTTNDAISTTATVTPTKLKNKLLRDLGYTLDPRSPALHFDRTPIVFNDSNISDDFSLADLSLNESNDQLPCTEIQPDDFFFTPVQENGKFAEQKMDPRSPSVEIERTPLALNFETQTEVHTNVKRPTKAEEEEEIVASIVTGGAKNMIFMDEHHEQPVTPTTKSERTEKTDKVRTPLSCLINTQKGDIRSEKRFRMHNQHKPLARTIFKDTTHSHSAKINNPSSRIPVMRKSPSNEIEGN